MWHYSRRDKNKIQVTPDREQMTDQSKDNAPSHAKVQRDDSVSLLELLQEYVSGITYRGRNESKMAISPKVHPSVSDSSWKLENWSVSYYHTTKGPQQIR